MGFFSKIFTWWDGATIGTSLWSAMNGEQVGTDLAGNRYFRAKKRVKAGQPFAGSERRWVIYNGEAEASRVPPDWRGWLTHTYAEPPSKAPLPRKAWEKAHLPNMTGTPAAYHPAGSLYRAEPVARRYYDAWQPE